MKDLYLNDLITLDEYRTDQKAMTDQLEHLQELDKPERPPDFEKIKNALNLGWRELYQDVSKEQKREFWQLLIKEIRIYPDRHIEFDLDV